MFNIIFAKSVKKDIKNIDDNDLLKIKKSINTLKDFPNLAHIKQLKAHYLADYRLRVGDYRVLFDVNIDDNEIQILKIGHRRDVYD